MTIKQSLIVFAGAMLLFFSPIGLAQPHIQSQLSPSDLVKAVIRTELSSSDVSGIHWRYLLEKEVDGRRETREVVETKSGSLDRLIAITGQPLTDAQQREETQRILRLSRNPEEQEKLEQIRQKDAERCNELLKMIPEAFVFEIASESSRLVKLMFKPNPGFQPHTREAKVLHKMAGEIWIDAKQQRLVSIKGRLMEEVKFGGGLLGHLEKGGQFWVKRGEIAPARWEVTEIAVDMQGKALFFKTISVQQKERHSNFQRVPDNLTLSDAAGLLLKQVLIATKR